MNTLKQLFKVSRFRFWHYLVGPWLVGVAAAAPGPSVFGHWIFWAGILYWSFPANLLVYGVNDIADGDTDAHNPKKDGYEGRVSRSFTSRLLWWIIGLNVPVGLLIACKGNWQLILAWSVWALLSIGYSMKPIRAKSIPIVDGVFNALYYMPGILGYMWAGGDSLNLYIVLAAQAWVMAMHAYSAVPDITADTKAGVSTAATWLGVRGTLLYCAFLWIFAAVVTFPYLSGLSVAGGIVYCGFMVLNLVTTSHKKLSEAEKEVFRWYTYFPAMNFVFGMVLFWYFYYPVAREIFLTM